MRNFLPAFLFFALFATPTGQANVVYAQGRDPVVSCPIASDGVAAIAPDRLITLKELDESIGLQLYSLKEKMYALRKNALENLINRIALEREAQRIGVSLEVLRKQLASLDGIEITENQISEAYSENLAVFSSLSLDEARERVRLDLETQARLRNFRKRLTALRSQIHVRFCLEEAWLSADVSTEGPTLGSPAAKVTIVEYSDFQCPYCRQSQDTLKQVLREYRQNVRLVFKHLPLPIHPHAFRAAQAAYCAERQGRFWEYHDLLFRAADLSEDTLRAIARESSLDVEQHSACLKSDASRAQVTKDVQEARQAGFQGTPTFVINGRVMRGAIGLEDFKRVIDQELLKRKEN